MYDLHKENIVVATSCFGLGPVGKLAAIVNKARNTYNWFAIGEKFDFSVFHDNIFEDICWSMDRDVIKSFLHKYNIRFGIVVLKNKIAKMLTELGIKVIYIDSLPFMWTKKDAEEGKIPYNVYCYCAQMSIPLNNSSKRLFNEVKNLRWIEPIVNLRPLDIKQGNQVLINLGGFSSPHGDNYAYIDLIIRPLLDILKQQYDEIIVTCGKKAQTNLKRKIGLEADITSFSQTEFLEKMYSSKLFFTSPGLTTIVETLQYNKPTIILPPQNLSQFYNSLFAQKSLQQYKVIEWLSDELSLKKFLSMDNYDEGEIVKIIYDTIIKQNTPTNSVIYKKYIHKVLNQSYFQNQLFEQSINGVSQVLDILQEAIEGGN